MKDETRLIIQKMADKIRDRVVKIAEERYDDALVKYEERDVGYGFDVYFTGVVYSILGDEIAREFEEER